MLAEGFGIGTALQPEHGQRADKRPCGPDRGQPDPEPAEPAPCLSAGLSCGL